MTHKAARYPAVLAVLGGIALITMPAAAIAQSIDQLLEADSNGDGSVTRKELLDMRAANFARLDRNDDGFVDSKDSPSFGPLKKRFNEVLGKIQIADANGDQRITKKELVDAPTPLFFLGDKDKNGVLSSKEIAALRAMAP